MSIRQLFIALVFIGISALSLHNTTDPDMWWHLRTGEYVLNEGIPNTDPNFSYTATDHEWFMHEWLSEVIMYGVYDMVGLIGLGLFFAMIIGLTFMLLYRAAWGQPYIAAILTLWSMTGARPYLGSRPQMFNLLLASLIILLMQGFITKRFSQKWLWWIVPLMALWSNLHSGFILGIVILGVYLVGGWLQVLTTRNLREKRDLDRPMLRFLLIILLSGIAASLFNPKIWGVWIYPFETTLFNETMRRFIKEWRPIDFQDPNFWGLLSYFIGIFLIFSFSKERLSWTESLFVVGTSFATLQSGRNAPIFIIVTVPIASYHAVHIFKDTRFYRFVSGEAKSAKISPLLQKVNIGLLVISLVVGFVYAGQIYAANDALVETKYPADAVAFIQENDLADKPVFNDYTWGGYFIWNKIPVFIDGRADLYGDELMEKYVATSGGYSGWDDTLDEFAVEYVVLSKQWSLLSLLELSPDWKKVYEDDLTSIYVRTDSPLPELQSDEVSALNLFGG